jgi:[glutamine synthetase] adenylyltransferase / [glutamine synthetase]-adenylyl-L-tyrosine phosphorylase
MDSAGAVLQHFGVDAERVRGAADLLRATAPALAAQLPELLAAAADPAVAVVGLEHLAGEPANRLALAELEACEVSDLFTLLGASPSLTTVLQTAGPEGVALFRTCRAAPTRLAADHERQLEAAARESWESFSSRLRQLRHREYLRIGLADLTGRYPVETTVAELSELAAGLFAAACRWACHILHEQYGAFAAGALESGSGNRNDGFVVLAMGKLGGGELNFSSDVDVMYLYSAAQEETLGGSRGTLQAREFFTRLAELVTRALHEVTSSGFAFRVDLRLRPDGVNGPIVNALDDAIVYYEAYGQTWERSAMIQARPIAGELELGERFLREVGPFVYRRYLDFTTVADMKEMKARVEAQLGAKAGPENVKLGRGGIREIEFLVQVLQLVHGGRDERVRGGGSLRSLAKLTAARYLPADEGEALVQAYRFLRNVEHKIQIVHQRQTHHLPSEAREHETLARRLGYRGADAADRFWADFTRHTGRVRRAFEKLFYEPAAETRRSGDAEVVELLRKLEDRDASFARLQAFGFAHPDSAYEDLLLLRDGPASARARVRRRQVLYDIAPSLLRMVLQSADPDLALRNVATFISSVGARTSFLALLRENPGTLRMLVELFGGSQFLANAFIRHPELLDTLVRADLARVRRSAADLAAELQTVLPQDGDFEASLDALRRFRNQEFLRIGINDLQSGLRPQEVGTELTALAEVCLRSASAIAVREICARYGCGELPGQLVVLALGKLGGGELNYNSDLDLIFVYEEAAVGLPLPVHEMFSKVAQRLITVLQVSTREGIVYRIDTRLRPSGRSGPLVSSLDGFRRYHETSAQIWERQALIKARPVAGTPLLAQRVAAIISDFVYRAPLRADDVREIRRLRGRMEHELARESGERVNIKTGRGGLVDVEFLTQMLQLHHGPSRPAVRAANTLAALDALTESGVLSAHDHQVLADGYRFLRRVENSLRLAYDRPVEDLDRTQMDLKPIAKRMGFAGGAENASDLLWQEFTVRREAIRACYERWFDRMEAELT